MYRITIEVILVMLAFIIFSSGCHDGCEPEEMKCEGSRVMICNAETDWEVHDDCADVEDFGQDLEWVCCEDPTDGIPACLPIEACEELDGGV